MPAMVACGIVLAQLIAGQSEGERSAAVTLAAELAVQDRERNGEPASQAPEVQHQPDAASVLRHVRGAPGTPYGTSDPEVDRRLNRMLGD